MPPTRVLFFNNRGTCYGAETSLAELVRYLRKAEPVVALPDTGQLSSKITRHDIRVIQHDIPRLPQDHCDSHRVALNELRRALTENPSDVLHLNKAFWFLPEALEIAAELGVKVVVHIRGEVELDHGMLKCLSSCDAVVAVSKAVSRHILDAAAPRDFAKALNKRLHVVTNGRTLSEYTPKTEIRQQTRRRFGIAPDHVVVALFGYFDPLKGQNELVDIAAHMCPEQPELRFLLVGDIIDEVGGRYRDRVQRRIGDLGLESQILAPGYIPAGECLPAVDIVVSLSRSEGFPGILIEAMAAGRAIVARAVGGVPEVIGPPSCGVLVNGYDTQEFITVLKRLSRDGELCEQLAGEARRRALAEFSSERTAAAMEALYESLR